MKKILAIALVIMILGSITVFAMGFNHRGSLIEEGYESEYQRGFGYRMGHMFNNQKFEGYGPGHMLADEEFEGYGPKGYMYSEKFMEEFDIGEEGFYEYMKERHEERIEYFVEEGIYTAEEAEEALKYFEENFDSESDNFVPRGRNFGHGACFVR